MNQWITCASACPPQAHTEGHLLSELAILEARKADINRLLALQREAHMLTVKLFGLGLGEGGHAIAFIQTCVAAAYNLRIEDMTSAQRPKHIAFPRQIAMRFCRLLIADISLSLIGEAFGGRDHGTVLHACHHVEDLMQTDPSIRQKVEAIERDLREKLKLPVDKIGQRVPPAHPKSP